ncbi:ferritin-like protein [Colletotrichum plurivorum]|uniref:Ferritin-like protein n=1 Tax=Colletotrichum plurivorum TaxID=2175906 RepID=A0A8H6NRD4_9PEZI|nr:ferritin-like protein [Colletotrichum plurivorum]
MRTSTLLLATASATSVLAGPLVKRADFDAPAGGDPTILNYALVLEYLETEFYRQGLANYTEDEFCEFAGDGGSKFYNNLKTIYEDEKTHVALIKDTLNASAIPSPYFTFPSTTARSFIALASVLEGVGVSAYLGATAAISEKSYVTPAGAILAVEARHTSYLRAALGRKPFPRPFDTPLNFDQVFSLASQFISGFAPGTPDLPFKAFPELEAGFVEGFAGVVFEGAHAAAVKAGTVKEGDDVYAVFFSGLDPIYAEATADGDDYVVDEIPEEAQGQVYVVLSTANGKDAQVSDATTIAGVAIIEVGDEEDDE